MKKTNCIKSTALLLAILMLLGASSATVLASAKTGLLYETAFDDNFDTLKATGIWDVESWQKTDATAPEIVDGTMKMDTKDSVKFNWTQVEGVGKYSPNKKYIFEFDAKVTNAGDGSYWTAPNYTRTMYVAFGGWYNQVEFNNMDSIIRAGDNYDIKYSDAAFKDKTLHYKLILEGDIITSAIYATDGSLVTSGSRTSSDYSNMAVQSAAMTYLVIRCEDGALEVDNFAFSVRESSLSEISNTPIRISSGKQAIYNAKITYNRGETVVAKFGSGEFFSISDTGLRLCGCQVLGEYAEGEYGLATYINPTNKLFLVEVTLPDGGIIRRGTYNRLRGTYISIQTDSSEFASDAHVTYSNATVADHTITDTEPSQTGFGANVYNLVSSFSNAQTNRLFAFTAATSYVGNNEMALKYREKGADEWITIDATKTAEPTRISNEDYFKAELSGLVADTEYEYKIGKKGSTSSSDWSEVYNFTTAKENIDEFSFIAIGDTQSTSWNMMKYGKAALDEAIKQTPNPAFLLHTGDVVASGHNLSLWNLFFKALGNYGATIPTFATIGNHDTTTNDRNPYFALHFNHPDAPDDALVMDPKIYAALSAEGKVQVDNFNETVYSYDYGNVHFIVLNSGTYAYINGDYPDDKYIQEAQRAWLERDLEENKDAKWTIVMLHEAIYHRKGGNQDRPYLSDIIEKYGVDLVIEGHSHLVTRTYPMKNGEIVTKTNPDVINKGTGTIYMTIGATTTNHDSMGDTNVEACQTIITPDPYQPTYTIVTVKGSELVLTTKQIDGLVLDTFTVKGAEEEPSTDEPTIDDAATDTPVTDSPATDTPAATDTPVTDSPATDTPAATDAKGCNSSVGIIGIALAMTLGTCTFFVAKKKEV